MRGRRVGATHLRRPGPPKCSKWLLKRPKCRWCSSATIPEPQSFQVETRGRSPSFPSPGKIRERRESLIPAVGRANEPAVHSFTTAENVSTSKRLLKPKQPGTLGCGMMGAGPAEKRVAFSITIIESVNMTSSGTTSCGRPLRKPPSLPSPRSPSTRGVTAP